MGVSQADIAAHLGLARSTVTKILNQFPTNRASKDTVKAVFKAARKMGYDFSRLRNIHRRRADRKKVNLHVALRIELHDGTGTFDTGSGLIRDISPFGAMISSIRTNKSVIPITPFSLYIAFDGPLEGVTVEAKVIRVLSDDQVQLGVNFIEVSGEAERRIIEFVE